MILNFFWLNDRVKLEKVHCAHLYIHGVSLFNIQLRQFTQVINC